MEKIKVIIISPELIGQVVKVLHRCRNTKENLILEATMDSPDEQVICNKCGKTYELVVGRSV